MSVTAGAGVVNVLSPKDNAAQFPVRWRYLALHYNIAWDWSVTLDSFKDTNGFSREDRTYLVANYDPQFLMSLN